MEGTREIVIARIMEWVDDSGDNPICWLSGPAGSGKSAIAQTIAELCAAAKTLSGSFFFVRGAGSRSSVTRFITTLAYHLALSVPATKLAIETALQTDPSIPHQSLEDQFRKLIINPILALNERKFLPMVIVVDALDECDDRHSIAEFIELLSHVFEPHPPLFKFFFTSRAEDHIQQKFSAPSMSAITHFIALQDFDAHADIHTFLQSRFETIYHEKPRIMRDVQQPWPSFSDIERLVEKSSGLFIFASTLVDFVTDGTGPPQRKLQMVLITHSGLDPLYAQVISAAPLVDCFQRVIGTIMLLREQLSITQLSRLLQLESADILQALLGIQSILRIPEDDDKPVQLIHASLRDFLMEERRSGVCFIDPPTRHVFIATDCLKILMRDLKHDIFATSAAQQYACVHWCYHLSMAVIEADEMTFLNSPGVCLLTCLKDFKSQSIESWINSLLLLTDGFEALDPLNTTILKLNVG